MLVKSIATVIACTFMFQLDQPDVTLPSVEMQLQNVRPVVGEPLVIGFVVRNETKEEICTPPQGYIENNLVRFSLHAYVEDDFVGRAVSGGDCSKQFGVIKIGGHCLEETILEPGQELHGHALAVMLATKGKDLYGPTTSVPIAPGKYTLRADVLWGSWRLKTNDVQIEIVSPSTPADILASELVDPVYAVFMSSHAIMGIGRDLMPVMSVKAILEQCSTSVHARLARSRLIVLQAHKLNSGYATTDEEHGGRKRLMRDVVSRIDNYLAQNHDDPLELDLMDGKIQLLRRLESENKLRQAIDALIAKYPNSGRARRAEDMWKQIHSNPNDR